jgi:hypothetical protein
LFVVSSLPSVLGPRWITYSTYRIAPPYSSERVAIPTYPVTFADLNLALSRFRLVSSPKIDEDNKETATISDNVDPSSAGSSAEFEIKRNKTEESTTKRDVDNDCNNGTYGITTEPGIPLLSHILEPT